MKGRLKSIFRNLRNFDGIQMFLYKTVEILRSGTDKDANSDRNVAFLSFIDNEILKVPENVFLDETDYLLKSLTSRSNTLVEDIDKYIDTICQYASISTTENSNCIKIVLHGLDDAESRASTLLNAGKTTNIIYRVFGNELTDEDIVSINSIEDHLPRIQALRKKGCTLKYAEVPNETFKHNLQFFDTCMPLFIAECLIADSEQDSTSKVSDVVAKVAERNPLQYTGASKDVFYEHKMKVLLVDAALGMTPAKEWLGKYDANGGYLVVRRDGEVVCYHFYNRNDIEDYLYHNTRFERASRTRYDYGTLYRNAKGEICMKLNLQIRFMK